jgi:hypothetical protein
MIFTILASLYDEHIPNVVERIQFVLTSQNEFQDAAQYPPGASDLDKAICDFIRWRQSFGGQGKSWSCTTSRARGGMAGDVNAWWTATGNCQQDKVFCAQSTCLHF